MTRSRSVLAAGVAIALAAGPVVANTKHKINDDDSVYSWGPWAVLAPAAGGHPVALLNLSTQNTPRNSKNTPQVEQPAVTVQGPCEAGASCGFATYVRVSASNETSGPATATFETDVTPMVKAAGGASQQYASFVVNAVNSTGTGLPRVTVDHLLVTGTVTGAFAGSRTQKGHFYKQNGAASYARRTDQQQKITNGRLPFAKSNPDVVAGFWVDQSLLYTYNSSRATDSNITELDSNPATSGGSGAFVAGNVTPQGDLDKLLAGNVQASYGGNMLVQNGVGAPVNISVDFGHGTWNGSWGTSNVAGGGQLPFKASGTVSGPNIVSNKLSAGVAGKVRGAFFGRNAGALAGTVDVRGTVNGANVHDVGVFLAGKGASPATAALR